MFVGEIEAEDEFGGAIWFQITLQSNSTYPIKRGITGYFFNSCSLLPHEASIASREGATSFRQIKAM